MPSKDTTPLSLYGNDREYLREQERTNELLADIAGETYDSPGDIPKGKYIVQKRLLDAAQKKNELLESIAGSGGGGGAAKGIDIDYGTDVISLTDKNGDPIQGSGATLPAYGVSFDPTTGGLTLTKNGTAMQGQTVTIPNYGSPVGVTSSSDMTDHDTIYLYEGTTGGGYTQGHFYYWDGTAWADGGEYAAATVQTDKTLLVENRAADAKAVGDAVGELKESLENAQSGLVDIGATWDRGTLTSGGNYSASLNYRVATKEKCTLQYDTNISVNDGFRIYYYIFGDTLYKSGWITSAKIPKGSVVTVVIARSTDDTSEAADIETFVSNVNFTNNVKAELDSASGLSKIAYGNTAPLNITAERISDNEYYQINDDGSIGQTASAIGVSDRIFCVGGDTLKYTLSTATGKLILAVFNASHQMTHSVTGTGYANYLTGEYTFTDDDVYFYVSGALGRITNYSVEYGNVPAIIGKLSESVEEIKTVYPVLPSYWSEYLNEKYPVLWQKDALIGAGGDSFVFVTDVHYGRNTKKSPMLIQNIVKNTAVKTVFNGGDTLDEGDTVALAIEKLSAWQGMMDGMRVFNIVGNHDNNNYNSQNPTGVLTMGQFYGIMVKPSEQWIDTNGKIYYCVDNPSQKIRYICLAIEAFANVSDGSEQKTWLESKLTELSSDWSIVILQHRIWGSTTDDIADKAKEVIRTVNYVWNNINADFIGIIAGHTHLDYSTTEPVNGYLLIACNCDTLSGNNSGYTRTAGTTSEQSFDVFHIDKANKHLYATRIGAGTDRDWSYQ